MPQCIVILPAMTFSLVFMLLLSPSPSTSTPTEWGEWSVCSAQTCGTGHRTRRKPCVLIHGSSLPAGCTEPHVMTEQCDTGVACSGESIHFKGFSYVQASCLKGPKLILCHFAHMVNVARTTRYETSLCSFIVCPMALAIYAMCP